MTGIPVAAGELVGIDYLNEVARAHWRKTSIKDVVNTTTETDLLNGEVTIDASAIGATSGLRLVAWGDLLTNTGGTTQVTPNLVLGATSIWKDLIDGAASGMTNYFTNNTTRCPWRLVAELINQGATNVQFLAGTLVFGFSGAPISGIGKAVPPAGTPPPPLVLGGSAAEDLTVAKVFAFKVALFPASVNLSMRLQGAYLQRI